LSLSKSRVQRVREAVPKEVEAEDTEDDRESREERDPPGGPDVLEALF
jgi:hypothetical protein